MEEVETTLSLAGETKVRLMLALVVTEFLEMSQNIEGGSPDQIDRGSNSDYIEGGTGDDNLFGGGGNEILRSNSEELIGDDGNERLDVGLGEDRFIGNAGIDTL